MKITMRTMAIDSFVPMLESLSGILDKAAAHARENKVDLPNARLAPDMYTLAQQVRLACYHAHNGAARLTGREPPAAANDETTLDDLKERIARTIADLRDVGTDAFDGAETRDCSLPIPGNKVIGMDGLRYLRAWALPHFYFHVVTAYDILRHAGVPIGKLDYLSQVGPFIRPAG